MKMVVVVWIIGYLVFEHLKISVKELVYQFLFNLRSSCLSYCCTCTHANDTPLNARLRLTFCLFEGIQYFLSLNENVF